MEVKKSIKDKEYRNFVENIILEDLNSNKHDGAIVTRFPPEPNGFLHVGHAKAICLNFGLARDNQKAKCHLRFDDTNPLKESTEYVDAIKKDVSWLGFDWGEDLYFSSTYFDKLFSFACELIQKGLAYVDSQSVEEIRKMKGDLRTPGKNSPFRDRSVDENMDLFNRMKAGEFKDGEHVLRAKIDMTSGNMNLRDPIMYRIRHVNHHRTGDDWCLYPIYDFAHGLSDSLEGITHSICTLEFEERRPLYNWYVENVSSPCKPQQIEMARLNLDYTVMSKRKLLQLVEEKKVDGWDDPRMPSISGMRRRGYTPKSIRDFCETIGVGKKETVISYSILEDSVRNDLNTHALRVMAVLKPIKVTITNWDKGSLEIDAPFHPKEDWGTRKINLDKEIYIESKDFMLDPPSPKKFYGLGPGRSVRLRYGCVITCDEVVQDEKGDVTELKCSYVEGSFNGQLPEDMKKVKGIIHWVNAGESKEVEVREYDRLFHVESPGKERDFLKDINPDSLSIKKARVEPLIAQTKEVKTYQFERMGYFTVDSKFLEDEQLVYNKTVGLRDGWVKKK